MSLHIDNTFFASVPLWQAKRAWPRSSQSFNMSRLQLLSLCASSFVGLRLHFCTPAQRISKKLETSERSIRKYPVPVKVLAPSVMVKAVAIAHTHDPTALVARSTAHLHPKDAPPVTASIIGRRVFSLGSEHVHRSR